MFTICKCLAPFLNAEETWQQIVFGRKVEESQTELVLFKRPPHSVHLNAPEPGQEVVN